MENNINERNYGQEENREVAFGICFGSGIGIIIGTFLGNVSLGLSAGGVLGILIGIGVQGYKGYKRIKSKH